MKTTARMICFICLLFFIGESLHAQAQIRCTSCAGSGNCTLCDGTGQGMPFFAGDPPRKCGNCGGSGQCDSCFGKGAVTMYGIRADETNTGPDGKPRSGHEAMALSKEKSSITLGVDIATNKRYQPAQRLRMREEYMKKTGVDPLTPEKLAALQREAGVPMEPVASSVPGDSGPSAGDNAAVPVPERPVSGDTETTPPNRANSGFFWMFGFFLLGAYVVWMTAYQRGQKSASEAPATTSNEPKAQ